VFDKPPRGWESHRAFLLFVSTPSYLIPRNPATDRLTAPCDRSLTSACDARPVKTP